MSNSFLEFPNPSNKVELWSTSEIVKKVGLEHCEMLLLYSIADRYPSGTLVRFVQPGPDSRLLVVGLVGQDLWKICFDIAVEPSQVPLVVNLLP
jgi:hypothetical protein